VESRQNIKRIFIYLLLAMYVFGLVKPVLPLAKDFVAHTFFKLDHLATVHYENGKFHVHAELMEESAGDEDMGKGSLPSAHESFSSHICCEELNLLPCLTFQMKETRTHYPTGLMSSSKDTFVPPPEV